MSSSEFTELSWISNPEYQALINEFQSSEPSEVALKLSSKGFPYNQIAQQIKGRSIARRKFPELLNCKTYFYPPTLNLEQSSSSLTAAYKAQKFFTDCHSILDGTMGMGIDAIAAAGVAKNVVGLEPNVDLHRIVSHNISELGLRNLTALNIEFEAYESDLEFDLIYLDPDRRVGGTKNFQLKDLTPDVERAIQSSNLKATRWLIKLSPMVDITSLLEAIPGIAEIHILSVANEVKEILTVIAHSTNTKPSIHCVELQYEWPEFQFALNDEASSVPSIGGLLPFVYLPARTIMKSGAFNLFATRFGFNKVAKHTHLYSSSEMISVPARCIEVIEDIPYNNENISKILSEHGKQMTVLTRNFDQDVKALRLRHEIEDGQALLAIFYKDASNMRRCCVGKRVY